MSCPCDELLHPRPPRIDAGLDRIPRQIADFSEFRRAMLAELHEHGALRDWNARDEDDLGVMLLEMWAYVCDVLAFYDEVIAHEAYVGTARRRPSLRKLADLVGHLPRPAVGARVVLAAIADGNRTLTLPAGTVFRSQAFDGEPPQVFELEKTATIHPLHNRWRIEPQAPATVAVLGEAEPGGGPDTRNETTKLFVAVESATVKKGDAVLIQWGEGIDQAVVRTVGEVESTQAAGEQMVRVGFRMAFTIPEMVPAEDLRLLRPTQTVGLWSTEGALPLGQQIDLDGLYRQIRPGTLVLLSKDGNYRWFKVRRAVDESKTVSDPGWTTVVDSDGEWSWIRPPEVKTPVTRLHLDRSVNDPERRHGGSHWSNDGSVTVHYALVEAGDIVLPKTTQLSTAESTLVSTGGGRPELPLEDVEPPSKVLLSDQRGVAAEVNGSLDLDEGKIELDDGIADLALPVDVFGNRLFSSRGETVALEILGSGDASIMQQSFKLKKKPLTYLPAPTADNENAVASTLTVWVDGIRWREERSFFGKAPDDRIYIVRQNDEGESIVTFRGPLPTGQDNVVASYRFGAGAAAPPAGAVNQIAKPVKRLNRIHNPLAAFGGDDSEGPEELRTEASRSALLLGRAISLPDFQARAANQSGVRAVKVNWQWQSRRQRPGVVIWYVGEAGIQGTVEAALREVADPTISIEVRRAMPVPLRLALDIEVEGDHFEANVLAEICRELIDPEDGLLAPERIGIGTPLFRSRIFERVLRAEGAVSVNGIRYAVADLGSRAFDRAALDPREYEAAKSAGSYFDVESGGLVLNGKEDICG